MKIGVFDSGVGGLSVVNAIKNAIPTIEVLYKDDKQHVPYGDKDIKTIHSFVLPILKDMQSAGCRLIVIACNTVTTNLISELRKEINVPLIGIEPMIKPAAKLTKTRVIGVCATPRTLESQRYKWLKNEFAAEIKIVEPDCSGWSYLIEHNQADKLKLQITIDSLLDQKADVIVLGCTHYHWIEQQFIDKTKGKAIVLQPEQAVITQLKKVMKSLN